jgi:hypothetical protein
MLRARVSTRTDAKIFSEVAPLRDQKRRKTTMKPPSCYQRATMMYRAAARKLSTSPRANSLLRDKVVSLIPSKQALLKEVRLGEAPASPAASPARASQRATAGAADPPRRSTPSMARRRWAR